MGLYNFEERFVPKILAGEKTHTIRAVRARTAAAPFVVAPTFGQHRERRAFAR
jgi:hypothetical protein